MTEDFMALLLITGLILIIPLSVGIAFLGGWIGRQIEARQKRPMLQAKAAANLADAERKLEEARIRRLELELGIGQEHDE